MNTGKAEPTHPPAAEARLAQAISLHQQGRLESAGAIYQDILRANPRHFDALHLLGVIALQQGRTQDAVDLIGQAVAADPRQAAARSNLGNALHRLGRSEEALAHYAEALRLMPDYAEAFNNQAIALRALNRLEEALASYNQAIKLQPGYATAWANRGNVLEAMGRLPDALDSYAQALRLVPTDVETLNNQGNVLLRLKRPDEALACYEQALRFKPDDPDLLNNRGNALRELNRPEEALACYERILRSYPDCANVLNNRGTALLDLGRAEEALVYYEHALRLAPDYVDAVYNRGIALSRLKRHEEALADYDQAIRLKPDFTNALNNRGNILLDLKRPLEALADYRRALVFRPDHAETHWNESLALLLVGDFERGLEKYEWRWQTQNFIPQQRGFQQPLWRGREPLRGKTLLLYAEQGFGDTLQCCRYAELAAAQGATVLLEVQPALKSLLVGLAGVSQVFARGEPLPPFDCHCPLLSLPLAFGTRIDTIPARIPYLQADPARVQAWQSRLGAKALPRIGLAWAGNPEHTNDRNRSIPLADFIPLATGPAQFISLHKELRPADAALLERCPDIAYLGEELGDFADTAALIANLDLVISVDTAVVHLAAALGKPVWLLLPFAPDWRWLLDRDDSPWYPGMRLFRQPVFGDWNGVLAEVGAELAAFLHAKRDRLGLEETLQAAIALHQQGRLEEAQALYQEVLRVDPGCFDALHLLGVIALEKRQHQQGVDLIRQAIAIDPNQAAAHSNLGLGLQNLGLFGEALASYDQALRLQPDFVNALGNRGNTLLALRRPQEALECYEQAMRLDPDSADTLNNYGNALKHFGRTQEALACYRRATQLRPDFAEAFNNQGNALQDLRQMEAAIASYEQAQRLKPDFAEAHWNEALARLLAGDFARGLEKYEGRWETRHAGARWRDFIQPFWRGDLPLHGKTILLHAEQGLGDTLQFCRYAKLVAARGATVLLEAQAPLKTLLARLVGVSRVLAQGEELPPFDCHCALLSLPLAFGTRLDTIPAEVPYLSADPARVEVWQAKLGAKTQPRIGLAWSGSPTHINDHNRSIALARFVRLAAGPAQFVSLQKDLREADRAVLAAHPGIARYGEELGDFADTAALIANLDLVVSADTAVTHLAAALGKPVWLLLPFAPDWRWLLDRDDSPWYPTMRLFRQPSPGDWDAVIAAAAQALDAFLAQAGPKAMPADCAEKLRRAAALHQQGQRGQAQTLYREILQAQPRHFDALNLLGILALEAGDTQQGVDWLRRATAADPGQAAAHTNLGIALRRLGQAGEALASYDRALRLRPGDASAHNNRGNALRDLKRPQEALTSYDRALRLAPDHVEAHNNRGNALQDLGRFEEALACYDRALRLKPDHADAHNNRGNALKELGRWEEALACYGQALSLKPGFADAFYNQGVALLELRRHGEAATAFTQALAINPDYPYALGLRHHAKIHCADWAGHAAEAEAIVQAVRAGRRATLPFNFLAVCADAAEQLRCARLYAADTCPAPPPLWTGRRRRHGKIRLAYLSADFRRHACAYLLARLFETHDRQAFETTAISYGPDDGSAMRARLQRAFGQFIDVRGKTDLAVAKLLHKMEIDIAVDLSGLTAHARPGILVHRPAPVQVGYMGYPGTLGADHIDYLLADAQVIPPGHEAFYAEQVVRLPDTYWVTDSGFAPDAATPSRAEAGLPPQGLVFCCFNQCYKITPAIFTVWMRLLGKVEGSVLWLLEDNPAATSNLRQEAARRGIAPERLVFAPRLERDGHLARHRLADLFLDTLPVNAHTTASDALRAGLPVLSCPGDAFASRVAASLLRAVGLPELIVGSLEEYEALAFKLATQPGLLEECKNRLAANRQTYPLFDTDRFRRHIEAAYATMWERYQRGEKPEGFIVPKMA